MSTKSSKSIQSTKRSFAETLVAVAWSFTGLRRKSDFDRDDGAFNPFYVLAGGVLGCALLVCALLIAVRLATP